MQNESTCAIRRALLRLLDGAQSRIDSSEISVMRWGKYFIIYLKEGRRVRSHYSVKPLVKTEGVVTVVFIKYETLHGLVECMDKAEGCLTCGVILLLQSNELLSEHKGLVLGTHLARIDSSTNIVTNTVNHSWLD